MEENICCNFKIHFLLESNFYLTDQLTNWQNKILLSLAWVREVVGWKGWGERVGLSYCKEKK